MCRVGLEFFPGLACPTQKSSSWRCELPLQLYCVTLPIYFCNISHIFLAHFPYNIDTFPRNSGRLFNFFLQKIKNNIIIDSIEKRRRFDNSSFILARILRKISEISKKNELICQQAQVCKKVVKQNVNLP